MELLGIKFNSLYMPLWHDDEVTFILDFFVYVMMTAIFSFLF